MKKVLNTIIGVSIEGEYMNNLWFDFLIEKFADEKNVRCCGSCQGGCLNPATCVFMCLGYTMEDIKKFVEEKGKGALQYEFEASIEM